MLCDIGLIDQDTFDSKLTLGFVKHSGLAWFIGIKIEKSETDSDSNDTFTLQQLNVNLTSVQRNMEQATYKEDVTPVSVETTNSWHREEARCETVEIGSKMTAKQYTNDQGLQASKSLTGSGTAC